jgi:NAD(P)-dependent dehydrogenase (short-subunit alcohol dehydrogenase family)
MARTALITGASRGLGRVVATRLAADGWSVWATMRDPAARGSLDAAVADLGATVEVVALDVSDPGSIARGVAEVLQRTGGRLDAVIANAGISAVGAFEDTSPEVMRAIMETNYFGAIETVRAALPALRACRGRIVLMSSDSGLCGTPALSGYTASKYALEGWGESLAHEVRPLGVSVSMIEPGAFRTDIWSSAVHRRVDGPYAEFAAIVERSLKAIGAGAPAPDPVAEAVVTALDARRPRLRYPVGRDARRAAMLKRLLPDRLNMGIMRRAMGLSRWRPS